MLGGTYPGGKACNQRSTVGGLDTSNLLSDSTLRAWTTGVQLVHRRNSAEVVGTALLVNGRNKWASGRGHPKAERKNPPIEIRGVPVPIDPPGRQRE